MSVLSTKVGNLGTVKNNRGMLILARDVYHDVVIGMHDYLQVTGLRFTIVNYQPKNHHNYHLSTAMKAFVHVQENMAPL